MADLFLRDLRAAVDWLDGLAAAMPQEQRPSSFHH
jgi:glutamate decarboxylase